MEYIERDKFIADKKWLYCTNCEKRKGKKRGKMVTLYEIGEAPCKSCGIHDMLEEIEMYPAADVRPVVRGRWKDAMQSCHDSPHVKCSVCGEFYWQYFKKFSFCPNCGAEMEES